MKPNSVKPLLFPHPSHHFSPCYLYNKMASNKDHWKWSLLLLLTERQWRSRWVGVVRGISCRGHLLGQGLWAQILPRVMETKELLPILCSCVSGWSGRVPVSSLGKTPSCLDSFLLCLPRASWGSIKILWNFFEYSEIVWKGVMGLLLFLEGVGM